MRRPVPLSRITGPDGALLDAAAGERGSAREDGRGGLTGDEARHRRREFGANAILEGPPSGWGDVLRDTLGDPMMWFLVGTSLLFLWLGELAEAAVLAIAMVPIAGMDAWLHRRTQASTEGLSGRLASDATVIRDGSPAVVAALDLVPGDLVAVAEGAAIPADGLIVAGDNIQIDESALTGEAMPVRKRPFAMPAAAGGEVAVDGLHWASAGTRLLTGEARVRIVFTGADTLYGQIVRSARASGHERTPLQHAIGKLLRVLVVGAVLLCAALAFIRYQQGYGAVDAVLSAVTLAVAALPEEFPVVFTFFLGVGVYRLAQRQALVRRAVVVENIGRVTCICTDKTGTLTEGQLTLDKALPGQGFDRHHLLQIAGAASRAESGDPLDALLLSNGGALAGERIAVFPFTEDRRREVAIVRQPDGAYVAAMKGAPETVLAMAGLDDTAQAAWVARTREFAATGHKVIACAWRRSARAFRGEPDDGFEFAGLLAFTDPVRAGVADAVAHAQAAGIRVIMVTGDHPATAIAIARELGIGGDDPVVVEGAGLAGMLDGKNGPVRDVDVIARAIPAQKLDLVQALQRSGEIVAVTGDGVNDVPALKGADIGIAMGERGTRSAREVASIVLIDDNFQTIVRAIAEGRQLFLNLRLSFAFLLMAHIPLVATAALVPLMGYPLLYLPVHIVWLELIIHPTALLVFQQRAASGDLGQLPRRTRLRLFDGREWLVIGLVGALAAGLVMAGFVYSLGPGYDVAHGRSMAMAALVAACATVTAALSGLSSRAALVATAATAASALVGIQFAPLARLLHMSPLHASDWLIAGLGGILAGAGALAIPLIQRANGGAGGHR